MFDSSGANCAGDCFHSQLSCIMLLIPQQFSEAQCGCTFKEIALCLNFVYVCFCPCTLCFWRARLRKIRSLEVWCPEPPLKINLSSENSDSNALRDLALETFLPLCSVVHVRFANKRERSNCEGLIDAFASTYIYIASAHFINIHA